MRTRELELMHQYSTKTCLTFSATTIHSEVWKTFVVQEAVKQDFLLDGLLGLSALHIASERNQEIEEYASSALEYQNRAFGSFREALGNLTKDNCHAVFAFSVIAMMSAIISTRFAEDRNQKDPFESILLIFELLEGIRLVSKSGREWLEPGPFGPVFDLWFRPISSTTCYNVELALNELGALNESMRPMRREEQQATLDAAIAHLETCFSKGKDMILIWLAMAGKEFMSELKRGDSIAMLIFLHWGVLLDRLRDEWWVEDSGKRLVETLSKTLLALGEVWDSRTIWARHQVGLS
jgi:Fungal specific transcription factor domain